MDEESALLMKTANKTVFEDCDDNHDVIDNEQGYFDDDHDDDINNSWIYIHPTPYQWWQLHPALV